MKKSIKNRYLSKLLFESNSDLKMVKSELLLIKVGDDMSDFDYRSDIYRIHAKPVIKSSDLVEIFRKEGLYNEEDREPHDRTLLGFFQDFINDSHAATIKSVICNSGIYYEKNINYSDESGGYTGFNLLFKTKDKVEHWDRIVKLIKKHLTQKHINGAIREVGVMKEDLKKYLKNRSVEKTIPNSPNKDDIKSVKTLNKQTDYNTKMDLDSCEFQAIKSGDFGNRYYMAKCLNGYGLVRARYLESVIVKNNNNKYDYSNDMKILTPLVFDDYAVDYFKDNIYGVNLFKGDKVYYYNFKNRKLEDDTSVAKEDYDDYMRRINKFKELLKKKPSVIDLLDGDEPTLINLHKHLTYRPRPDYFMKLHDLFG